MNFPKFWAKGYATSSQGRPPFECWGWSNASFEEAKRLGEEHARNVAARFAAGAKVDHRRYYGDRPFREEVLERIGNGKGLASAVITRNSYGCQVLNTAGLMFIDVDLEDGPDDSDAGWWSQLLWKRPKTPPPKNDQAILERARQWTQAHAGWGWRVYRTRAGLRFIATHEFFDPVEMARSALFDALTADPLYRKLCESQKCFRARLTPKPWRCKAQALTVPWPWANAKAEKRYLEWEKKYRKTASEYSTCDLIQTLGNPDLHPEIAPVIQVHDQRTRVGSGSPLA
jgi:hypothetical protein